MENTGINVVYRNIGELVEPDYNPRKITAKQKEDIRKSLEKFGFVQPLVVNTNPERKDIVIGGNQRLKIAKIMGFEQVPCYELDFNWLRNVLNLTRKQNYKNSSVGEAHVLTVQEFQQIWEEATGDEGEDD